MKPQTLWQRVARAIRDRSFILGTILVSFFILVAVLGPEVAPNNPFHRDRVQVIGEELQRAPFAPSEQYLLGTDSEGRDMLSLLLYGARQTLVIAFVAMVARLLLGLLLGTLAGWWSGSLIDRAITALTEFLAAIPGLILAILLVLAVGIRRGQVSFIIALSLVGWGEVTQIVRGHVMTLRNRLFVLASRAVGLSQPQVLSRHILPNLLSTLLALAALEMGGVLLLLGELGFLHIFIGGGGMYVDEAVGTIHYFEVPDWGAMLGTSWAYFRSLPWLPMAPALAFFISILGFNLFGYGLQRFVEKGRFHPSGWSVFRFFAVVALLLWGAQALLDNSSLEAQFADMARQFDVQRTWNDIAYMTQPELEGRPTGPGGGFDTASYIAHHYRQSGLTDLTDGTYFQTYETVRGQVTAEPSLTVLGPDGEAVLQLDDQLSFEAAYADFPDEGVREAELVVWGNPRADATISQIVLMIEPEEGYHEHHPGVTGNAVRLRIVPEEGLVRNDIAPRYVGIFGGLSFGFQTQIPPLVNLRISRTAARQLLAEAGLDLDELQEVVNSGERVNVETGLRLQVEAGILYEEVPAVNVVGYFPAADMTTQGERVLVMAPYTGPPPREGVYYPGADENASGVAIMLEVARLWHDIGFEPKRTVVFAAIDSGGEDHFMNFPVFPAQTEDTWTAVMLWGLGAGSQELERMEAGYGLARTFDQSARRFRVQTEELTSYSFFFTRVGPVAGVHPAYSGLIVTRPGDELSGLPTDTAEHLDPALLSRTGQTVAHYLMVLSSR